jgi:DNA-binding CsgD family transcriptional regulator
LKLYEQNNQGTNIVFEYKNSLKRKIDIPIHLKPTTKCNYYIEVLFKRSFFFPAKIVSLEENMFTKRISLITDSLFYGFSLVVFIINFLFFLNTKNKFFLYYCFLLLGIILGIMDTQGLFSLFTNDPDYKFYVIFILRLLLVISHILFTMNALELYKYYPKHKIIGKIIVVGFILSHILFFITSNLLWHTIALVIFFFSIIFYWLYGVLLFRKLVYARFYVVAYFSLLFFEISYMLSVNFGVVENAFTDQYLKIGGFIEMMVFLYAISYRHKEVEKKKGVLEKSYTNSLKNIRSLEAEVLFQKNIIEQRQIENLQLFILKHHLTLREGEVLLYIVEGLSNKQISDKLYLSESSIKQYCSKIYIKANVEKRMHLVASVNKYLNS